MACRKKVVPEDVEEGEPVKKLVAPTAPTAADREEHTARHDPLQEAAGAPIWVSKCNRDRWIGAAIVPTKGADEYAVAKLKNDVLCSGFTEVFVKSDNGLAILALKESAATALIYAGVNVKIEESALKATA